MEREKDERFQFPALKASGGHESMDGDDDRPSTMQQGSKKGENHERAGDPAERSVLELEVVDIPGLRSELLEESQQRLIGGDDLTSNAFENSLGGVRAPGSPLRRRDGDDFQGPSPSNGSKVGHEHIIE
jgi:hypothetical protein